MKRHQNILLVAIISLTLFVVAAGTYYPSWQSEPPSVQLRKDSPAARPEARLKSRVQNNERVILAGEVLPFLLDLHDQGRVPASTVLNDLVMGLRARPAQDRANKSSIVEPRTPGNPNWRQLKPDGVGPELGIADPGVAPVTDRTSFNSALPIAATQTATSFAALAQSQEKPNSQDPAGTQQGDLQSSQKSLQADGEQAKASRKPKEERLIKARSFYGDLRDLPRRKPVRRERAEREKPQPNPTLYPGPTPASETPQPAAPSEPASAVQAPAASIVFEGLDRENWGAGSPPDTTGDVGPTYYIQSVNTSVGIYRKSDGFREAAFTFDTLMSQGNQGNLCDTNNFGDPVVLYDTFDDRWIITDFAFLTDAGGNVLSPAYQCFAVSMNGNPLTGGWNFYSIQAADFLNDYPKLGIWTDGLYMSANMFSFGAGSTFQGVRVWALNKAQMYAGSPTVKVVLFNLGTGDFTVVPANARLQTGTPPTGRPNPFLSTWNFLNGVGVYNFHVDWTSISLSTFTGPDVSIAATSWPNANVANAPQSGTAQLLDVLQIRAMVQNQYTNFGGTESLWIPHTVRRGNTTGFAAPRWYQVNISGGTVAPNLPQAATWDPDAANVIHRFMPSLALDRAGNMAMGYTTSSSAAFPSLSYAGRLSTDPINTFGQTEQTLFSGTASQTSSARWGDYSSMMLDPDGCTFWYTNEYANPLAQTVDKRWLTKIGSFKFAECTPVGAGGTVSGTVTDNATSLPISGATVALGSTATTTNPSGFYTFSDIPAGTYPSITASFAGYGSSTVMSIVVVDAATTTQDFLLTAAPTTACLTDTTQADFLLGVLTNVDVNTSPGDVTLIDLAIDQQNTAGTTTGTGFGTPAWTGQTFTPTVNGQLVAADIQVFCNGCGATPPNLTLSARNTAAGLPTGADLASVTIPGSVFSSGATVTFTASFGAPATLTSGTQYALILRPVSVPAGSGYFWIRSSPSTYASGSRVLSANSGGTWSTDTTRDYNFKTYMRGPYSPTSGNLVSGTKDANPAPGLTPIWSTCSWNATTPASTSLKFQLAGSNSANGLFNFVGPDGTAATFFTTSPASLDQFYGLRYLQYKAFLSTTDSAVTPTLNDVTICFADVDCSGTTPTITPSPAQVCANSTGNTASGPGGMTTYSWGITNGTITSTTTAQNVTYTAAASGNVTLTLTVTTPSGCITPNSLMVPINPIPNAPIITPGGPTTFCAGNSVTLTSSSASGNQWFIDGNPIGGATNQQYIATASGAYTAVVTEFACGSAPSAATNVIVNPLPATPTITPGGPATFCAGGSVTLTSSSASGNQWYLNGNPIGGATSQQYIATDSGDYTTTVTASGCTSAPSTATTVTVNPIPATPTIAPAGTTTFCAGGSVTLTSSSATGNQWFLNGNPIGGATNQQYAATSTGDYTTTVTASGCPSAPSAPTSLTLNSASPVVTTNADNGAGSLRQAIIDACDGMTISFDAGLSGQTIALTTGELAINKSLTIQGPGSNVLTISGNGSSRVFNVTVANPGVVAISGLTIANGQVAGGNDGGGIRNSSTGTVSLSNSTVSNNTALNSVGGGILNASGGTLNVINSTLSNNSATSSGASGGGICNSSIGSVNVSNSTLSGNSADSGGGISNLGTGTVSVTNNTISANSAVNGGGILNFSTGTVQIRNSIIATNTAASNPDLSGTMTSLSHNLIGKNDGSAGFTNGNNGDVVGTSAAPISPLLGPLANNGGPTQTQSLLPGSAALNAGDNCVLANTCTPALSSALTTDQRGTGFNRAVNTTVDIGAFESRGFTITVTSGSSQSTRILTAFGSPLVATVSSAFSEPVAGGLITFTAPASGASGSFDGNVTTATIDTSGVATSSTFNANATAGGPYNVLASIGAGLSTVNFALTNLKGDQTINFGALAPRTFGEPDFSVSATTTSGLLVSFVATGNCTVTPTSPGTVHLAGAGACTITASQSGDSNYNPAVSVAQSFTIAKLNQTINFGTLIDKVFGDADFAVSASATAGLTVSFGASGACTISGSTVHIIGGGSCTITAMQAGDSNFNPASDVPQNFTIAKANQTITFVTLAHQTFGDPDFVISATSSSGLTVSIAVEGDCTATAVSPSTVHLTGVGICATVASQSGDGNYNAASNVPQNFSIGKASQAITFGALASKTFGDSEFTVNATSDAGLTVAFAATGNCIVTAVSPGTVHLGGAGSCTITASQGGDGNHDAAINVSQEFAIAKANTTTVLSSSVNPSDLMQAVTFTASVTGPAGTGTPTGTVQFRVDGSNTGPAVALNANGVTTLSTASLTATTHTVTAEYSGDANFAVSTSALGQVVNNPTIISFGQSTYAVNESAGIVTITVIRNGDPAPPVSVDYITTDSSNPADFIPCSSIARGTASSRCDFSVALGTLRFAANETTRTFDVLITQDSYEEGTETLQLFLSNPVGGAILGTQSISTLQILDDVPESSANPILDARNFVRQHYLDFLNREPDQAGWDFWTDNINKCHDPNRRPAGQSVSQCLQSQMETTSAAFFVSPEFQYTAFYVFCVYQGSLGRRPSFLELMRDTQQVGRGIIVANQLSVSIVETNRAEYLSEFVQRVEFLNSYGSLDSQTYVDRLFMTTGTSVSSVDKQALVDGLNVGTETRASVLHKVVNGTRLLSEGQVEIVASYGKAFSDSQYNAAFVQMEYFGYLRRNEDTAGFDFWLAKLNFFGNFLDAEMVRAFLTSPEYRQRFGPARPISEVVPWLP